MRNRDHSNILLVFLLSVIIFILFNFVGITNAEAATVHFRVIKDNTSVYHNIGGRLVEVGKLEKGQEFPRAGYRKDFHLINFGGRLAHVKRSDTEITNGKSIRNRNYQSNTNREIRLLTDAVVYDTKTGYTPFAKINKGVVYPIVTSQTNWWGVDVGGRLGFIHKTTATPIFLASDKYFKVNNEPAEVYKNIGGKLTKVGELVKGQEYRRAGGRTDWHLIEFGKGLVHVKKSVTEPSNGKSIKNTKRAEHKTRSIKTISETIFYDINNGKYTPVAKIGEGTEFPLVLEQTNWWGINVGGRFGVIPKSTANRQDIIINCKDYNYTFKEMVDIQMSQGSPKADGAGVKKATRSQVEYYANPANFPFGTPEFFQFLVLTSPAGLDAKEINNKILSDKGILKGQGQAFIDAAKKHNINEIYLISHVLHETNHGKSTLANGVPVDKNGKVTKEGSSNHYKTVYNMYGYDAVDSNPLARGAKYAFDQGWFTPRLAIIGGAANINNNYFNEGQDTLYKMKWNPAAPGTHQYATHVQWATIQAKSISNYYNNLENYTLKFEVPRFKTQPSSGCQPISGSQPSPGSEPPSSEPELQSYPVGIYGNVTGVNSGSTLRLRSTPDTTSNNNVILGIPYNATNLEIIGKSGSWYKVKYNGETGWASAEYIELQNLLEVTASNLNIRKGASTSYESLGKVGPGDYLAAKLVNGKLNTTSSDDHIWYEITYNGSTAWISGGKNGTEYIKVVK